MRQKIITKSFKQTQKSGEEFARKIVKTGIQDRALVLGLQGELGGGKTTFLQGFAKGLGIKEKILSPTFVIMKRFKIKKSEKNRFDNFYHIDCYRISSGRDMQALDFKKIAGGKKNIIAVEWPEKIKKILPANMILIKFKFIDVNRREITFNAVSIVV